MKSKNREQFLKEYRWMQRCSKFKLFIMLRGETIDRLIEEKEDIGKHPEKVLQRLKTIQTRTEA